MDYEFHRRSIRMKGYDYAQVGVYYVTVCVQNMECLLGNIKDGRVVLNNAGTMVGNWLNKIPEKFENVGIDTSVIMPNHIHVLITQGGHVGPPLPQILQWFKTMTTNEYIKNVYANHWPSFNKRFWQRDYYERVVRNEKELEKFRNYIFNNPLKWEEDEYRLSR